MVKDINPSGNSNPSHNTIFEVGGTTYFMADDGFARGHQYWTTRGTALDTKKLELIPDPSQTSNLWAWDGAILMRNGDRFFQTDGTPEGTHELQSPHNLKWPATGIIPVGGGFLLRLFAPEVGEELFLVTPVVESNPRVTEFDYRKSDDRLPIIETVSFAFNSDVSASLTVDDLLVTDVATRGFPIELSTVTYQWDATTYTATWDLTPLELSYGVYNFELGRAAVYDRNNNRLDGNGDGINGDSFRRRVATAIAGDVNLDGGVDFSDFVILSSNYTRANQTWVDGDLDGDGRVSFPDFVILRNHFGRSTDHEELR